MTNDAIIRDSLTGVYSRNYLYTRLNEELKRANRYDSWFSILLVDLDYFKSVNDAFGHQKGDLILREFAKLLESRVRKSDMVFRYGGDEFVVLMPYTTKQKALVLAERLLEQNRTHGFGENKTVRLTMSCGIATFPDDGDTAEDIFEVADQHHYLAKRNGRDCVIFETQHSYEPNVLDDVSRLIERDDGLATARLFIDKLPGNQRSLLRVSGESGLGATRFLQEVGKIARLGGFGVLSFRGSRVTENRRYNVVIEAFVENFLVDIREAEKIFLSQNWLARINSLLTCWLNEKGYSGLLITLENVQEIDRASLDVFKGFYFSTLASPLGLIFADNGIQAQQIFPFGIQPQNIVKLNPLSLHGIQVWLRQSLHNEPSTDFVQWIAEKTNGYPAKIQKTLEQLVQIGIIRNSVTGVSLADNYRDADLENLISATTFPSHKELSAPSTSDFFGRYVEINTLKKLIIEERLVSVVGMGGVGKSRLAHQVVLELQENFVNGVLFLSLTEIPDYVNLIYILANKLELQQGGELPGHEQLANYLFNKEILIYFDNIDCSRPGLEIISYLLENTSAIRFLVTSREKLELKDEIVFELQGLPVPADTDVEDLGTFAAIQLFQHVAQRGKPELQIQEEDWPYIVKICRRLSGFPLGIELAAAWVDSLTYSEIAEQFVPEKDSEPIIPSNEFHHGRSLQTVFMALWERFSKVEQESLVAMTVFQGSFSRHAAQVVLNVSLFFLDALVAKSILRRSGQDRYIMHEFIKQQLVFQRKDIADHYAAFLDGHSLYFLGIAAGIPEMIQHINGSEFFSGLHLDFDNILSAWNWAVKRKDYQLIYPAAKGLFIFFEHCGRFKEGKELFSDLLIHLKENLSMDEDSCDDELFSRVLACLGKFDYHLGDYEQSQINMEKALGMLQCLGLRAEEAHICFEMASLKRAQGEYQHANELLEKSLKYYREIGDRGAEGDVLNSLGVIASGLGMAELAEEYYSACLEKFQVLPEPRKLCRAMNNLGYSYIEKGDYSLSEPLLRRSLEISSEIKSDPISAAILESLGSLKFAMGDYPASIQYYREALKLCKKINFLPLALEIILGFAMIAAKQGDVEQAIDLSCLVFHHPSAIFEIRERAEKHLCQLDHPLAKECLDAHRIETRASDVEHTISFLLFPHQSHASLNLG